ncbi:MAG TPA: hypothetical protein VN702_17775 [Acetobacteraceae bacterium]|nr:hypothetical protein [Acetobacteraceae bacterium]
MTLTEIIARLEAATGADRRLDAEIARAIGCQVRQWNSATNWQWIAGTEWERLPFFTASVDAALTLIPPAHDWSLHCDNGEAVAGCMPASEEGCDWSNCSGPTPAIALALCIAALKARNV